MDPSVREPTLAGRFGRAWALLGVLALLSQAIFRLGRLAVEALSGPLEPWQWLALAAWTAAMIYGEGVRGFQRGFSARVVARAWHLARHPTPLHVALAPLYAMGLVHATRRRLISSWLLTSTMVGLIITLRVVGQPTRGLVDFGVVAGLVWGVIALLVFAARGPPAVPLDLPLTAPAAPAA